MGGVLLFAEGAACRQGCSPIRSATGVSFATPQQLTALGSLVRDHAAHHAWWPSFWGSALMSITSISDLQFQSHREPARGVFCAAATDKGEETNVMGRLRSGQQPAAERSARGPTQCAIEFVAGGRERAAHHCPATPARQAQDKCISHRQITVARRRKSRARSQRDPAARKLAVSPRGRLASWSKLRPPALHCELRAQAPREGPASRDCKPQQQTQSASAKTANITAVGITRVRQSRRRHSRTGHMSTSPAQNLPLHARP